METEKLLAISSMSSLAVVLQPPFVLLPWRKRRRDLFAQQLRKLRRRCALAYVNVQLYRWKILPL